MAPARALSLAGSVALAFLFLALVALGTSAQDASGGYLIPPVSTTGTGAVSPAYSGCGGVWGIPSSNPEYEQEVVERVNAVRAQNGLPPLKRFSQLDQAARYFATDMGQDNYFSHDTYDRSDGNLVYVCSWIDRVKSYYSPYSMLAENIAAGYSTPESVMNAWMNSSGHRANILGSSWEIGVGYYQGSGNYYRYWVQDFGKRSGVYPLIINQEAARTDSRQVSLYIYGAGVWDEMRLRNDSDPWTAWQPFQTTLSWTLGVGVYTHTVWAELRKGSNTTVTSDTIYLTCSPVLGGLPSGLTFTYSIPERRLLPAAHQVTPQNAGDSSPLTWTITTSGTWFTASPLSGATPASFFVTPTAFSTGTVATYSGAITVTVVSPAGIPGSPHRITVTLRVAHTELTEVYLPIVMRNYPDADGGS